MNTPNKLTLLRVLLIPFFVWAMYVDQTVIALVIFVVASATDALDGHLARKHNLVTNFGKFMDPIADKLLVMAALLMLFDRIGAIAIIVMLGREFVISGFRLVASDAGVVIAAGKSGKLKTIVQMVMIVYLLIEQMLVVGPTVLIGANNTFIFAQDGQAGGLIGDILIWASVILSLYSCFEYIRDNFKLLEDM